MTAFGLVFLAAFFEKAFFEPVTLPVRLALLFVSVLLILPNVPISIVGTVLGLALIVWMWIQYKKNSTAGRAAVQA